MMITLKNTGKGPRAVLLRGGKYEFLQPGESRLIDGSKVRSMPADVVEVALTAAAPPEDLPEQPAGLDQQATTAQPMPLSEMTRAELEAEAKAEGIDLEKLTGTGKNGALVMADIRKAIEAKRAGGAQ